MSGFSIWDSGFRVQGLGLGVKWLRVEGVGLGFRVYGCKVQFTFFLDKGHRMSDIEFRI